MKRALELAKKGEGFTNPNPLVGAVFVKNDEIVGEGYHQKYGQAHAEVNAIKNATENLENSTLYVTLEPCSHYGQTPPCVEKIIEQKVSKVIIGMKDPNPLVAGRGIEILESHGISVEVGVLEEECKKINEIFIKYIQYKSPFVILKAAMTLDGKIASKTGDSKWISSESSREITHQIRNRVSAILVGVNTVLMDNPRLTTRLDREQVSHPIRVIVDTKARIPLDATVLEVDEKKKTILATTDLASDSKLDKLRAKGIDIIKTPVKDMHVDLKILLEKLSERKIDSILVEGGSQIQYSFLDNGLVDKVALFIAPKMIGGTDAIPFVGGDGKERISEAFQLESLKVEKIDKDLMIEGYLKKD